MVWVRGERGGDGAAADRRPGAVLGSARLSERGTLLSGGGARAGRNRHPHTGASEGTERGGGASLDARGLGGSPGTPRGEPGDREEIRGPARDRVVDPPSGACRL